VRSHISTQTRADIAGIPVAHSSDDVIRWETPQGAIACGHCGSTETEISFEFLAFTRRICRACGETFYTMAPRSTEDRVFDLTPTTRKTKQR
jgi:hypothetical protein